MEVFIKFTEESRKRRQLKRFKTLVFQRQLQLSNVRIFRVIRKRRLFAKSKSQDSFNTVPPWWENEKGQVRNWLDLPQDITLHFFKKVEVVDMLRNTTLVCSAWRDLSRDPCLFTRIMISKPSHYFTNYRPFPEFMKKLVDKSCGQMIEFCVLEYIGVDILELVSLRGHSLRYLKVDGMSYSYLRWIAESFSQLEHLDISDILYDSLVVNTVREIGCACPNLKHLRLHSMSIIEDESRVNDVAFTIAKYAPRLRSLRLFNNRLRNKRLQAILEGCPELEYIGLQKCLYINIRDTDWLRRCSVLRNKVIEARVYNEAKGNFECYLWTKDK